MNSARTLFALPGVVIHELGHYLLCLLVGAQVQEVVFFQREGPSGYVVHSVPKRLRQHAVIVAGPLILNTIVGFLLFRVAVVGARSVLVGSADNLTLVGLQTAIATVLGASIALQAIPSQTDARSLWYVAVERLQKGNLLALLAIPIAGALLAVNLLRRVWIDWLYVLLVAVVASQFPRG